MTDDVLVTTQELAERFKVTRQTIYHRRKTGRIPADAVHQISAKTFRYNLTKILDYFESLNYEPEQLELPFDGDDEEEDNAPTAARISLDFSMSPDEEEDYE